MASRQLRWLGKVALMDEFCLPRKFLAACHRNPHLVDRRQTIMHHSFIHTLHMIITILEDDKAGKLSDWFPQVTDDTEVLERQHTLLMPNILGQKDCNELL
eukprot:2539090-Ditylum_brightwellii.AAC.1